ncbi:MAG: heavy metal translocating P-type ATPase [Chlamydiia bacterium]|nr:heavy metal translocating P-type ATPase [Chlamydiia bacterium]
MSTCALCSTDLPRFPIVDNDLGFCCPGCQAVYRILEAKAELSDFREHPVFQRALESGLISNPLLIEELRAAQPQVSADEKQRLYLEIGEMWCPSCAEVIRLYLLRQRGVLHCIVDYATDLCSIEYSPRHVAKDEVLQRIRSLGYQAEDLQSRVGRPVSKSLLMRFSIAAFCALNIMMFSYPIYVGYFYGQDSGLSALFAKLSFAFALPVLAYSALPIWKRCVACIRVGFLGMETLVAMGVGSALALSVWQLATGGTHVYFDSMAMIIVFVLLGKIIESKAKFSAKESLFTLTRSLPRRGRKRFHDGSEAFVPLQDIEVGDTLLAYPGEKIVLDGVVKEGEAAVDESLMTGESIPVSKREASSVLGGSCVRAGRIAYEVTSCAEESALQRIIQMVEQDIGHKSNYVRVADVIVRIFVPCILMLAFGVSAFLFWSGLDTSSVLLRAISILLISCPCAIGIAAPLAESLLLHRLASLGAIIRNRGCIQFLGRETIYVFDKTGTVTEGRFTVHSGLEKLSPGQRAGLRSIAEQSIHPVSLAVSQALPSTDLRISTLAEHSGLGLVAEHEGLHYFFGSEKLMAQHGIQLEAEDRDSDVLETRVFFGCEGTLLASIRLGDALRPDAIEAIQALKDCSCMLLSGDHPHAVTTVAKRCGISSCLAHCTPVEKREKIAELRAKGEIVAMVGDGINDAPSLTAAHIGISVLSASDLSIQVSDVLLTSERLNVLPQMRSAARLGRRIIHQNLFWAFFYNVIGIGLACGGMLSPLFATFAMVSSSLVVIGNALRLRRSSPV